jgi:hypothetical protein
VGQLYVYLCREQVVEMGDGWTLLRIEPNRGLWYWLCLIFWVCYKEINFPAAYGVLGRSPIQLLNKIDIFYKNSGA